ncbi:amino acid ABC transporter permease [Deinococcus koreensis]|uniref:ABC transmembrane type-1 domain-containing protein n=1 Tax=Deinococcus koreensis TaxID=2054903 RepID=A0A2K3USC2_9DEIO|nr:amino acid ABC transporter permease [Deinococcus koreensis]PNY79441.1 hypothetical protein CVO96_18550 [Deinococcus koreensis]
MSFAEIFTPDVWRALLRGAQLTVSLSLLAAVFGLLLGVVAGLARMSRFAAVRLLAGAYIETFRGTPLLVQLFFLYFAVPQFLPIRLEAYWTAVVGLSLFAGAYAAEIVRGSLNSVPRGQTEAARALGLSPLLTLTRVQIPQALRIALPAFGNQFIGLLKDSSLAGVITVTELLLTTRGLVSINFQPVWMYLAVGLIYYLLSYIAARLFALLEHRLNRPYLAAARLRP